MSDHQNDIIIEPLQIEGIVDNHVHCDYSVDAQGTIEEYCEAALKRNLSEICFTTHFDCNPNSDRRMSFIRVNNEKLPATIENLAPYVDHVRRAADEYFLKGLSVKLGVEFGWYDNSEAIAERLKEAYPFDYFLCGIHEIEDLCFCCHSTYKECFERYKLEEAVSKYYQTVNRAISTGLFDTIAHLTYYIKYGKVFYGDEIITAHEDHLSELFSQFKKYDTAMEINTAGIRYGSGDYYPSIKIINEAKKNGVRVDRLGSDAHQPNQVGFEFELAAAFVPDNVTGSDE